MIDYPDQADDRQEIPGVPDDIKYLGSSIADVAHWVKKTYDALRRQESPNPTALNFSPNPDRIIRTSTRFRGMALVFSGGTANDPMELRAGRGSVLEWVVPASPSPFTLPWFGIIEPGIDYEIVSPALPDETNWRAYLWVYTELEDGGN